ncbi:MAG: membrane protein insertase YidC [Akkermansiaceae bacterium]|jgi:YidC/Oxa1 family membrane protein insertase|nr:membrane protein insertase YidC [Akkermansiaceae bacterium]MDP4647624.1 membrane protein insertase YidC [Akkermansiaceae bacterium]MDP4722317.1 membrane protein insertase YidC [Akkermansiaceae bacterium]MDP4780357.1 membrane protein insertase YidC [Akkermansiaceae bacterium]MDP4846160.1 membrane protein insertase YidC [Akkermansiaceae bacterium]
MYDRKTWIVLALCGVLISLNIHFASKNPPPTKENKESIEEVSGENESADTAGLTVETPPPPTNEELILLENDEVAFTLSTIGGGIKYAELKKQKNVGKSDLVRINRYGSGPIGGLVDSQKNQENSSYAYKADQSEPGKTAVFIAKLPTGIIVKKTYSLEVRDIPGKSYFLNLSISLQNTGDAEFDLSQYGLYLGTAAPLHEKERPTYTGFFWHKDGTMHFETCTTFTGGWFSSEKSIITSEPGDIIEYAGVTDQFFTTVIRPQKAADTPVWGKPQKVRLSEEGKTLPAVRAAISFPSVSLAPGAPVTFKYSIFTGPKANTMLRKLDNADGTGDGWGDMMQYGFFSPVSRFLNFVLNHLHDGLAKISSHESWGLSIICLTLIVRICIWPLHAKSTHSMKRMSKLQPKMKELKEKYADDPNKLNTEMMGLYRKYGINPLGGCLPMLIQIPIFFGFFKMLDYAVELRNQPFLWVDDLSQPDTVAAIAGIPINLLPIVMAATSAIQMAMMPKTGDKMQQRIMMFMPLMFFFFCYNYASALALYWTTQNIFSIGQTYLMNKIPEPELVARKDGGKKSWVQRMAEKQAEMQKLKQTGNMRDVTPDKPKKKGPPRTGGR